MISVIVANYNNQEYISDCLNSVLAQTFKNVEVIIVDDASTDDSLRIIKDYMMKYPNIVKGIFNSDNYGVARTRHKGILQAVGDHITTLDSDDYYYDDQKLAKEIELVRYYKKKHNKDICSYSNAIFVNKEKKIISPMGTSKNLKEGNLITNFLTRSSLIPINFLVKKSAYFEVAGYDFGLVTHEDWDLKIRLAEKYEFYFTGITGTAYRRHRSGLSSKPHLLRSRNLWRVFFKNIHLIPKENRKKVKKGFYSFMVKRDQDYIDSTKKTISGEGFGWIKKMAIHFKKINMILFRIKEKFF
jgi:glycosyltransferase involved in cell wall biosynthesis